MIKKVSELFGITAPDSVVAEVREDTDMSPYIPAKRPGYVFRKEILSDFLAWMTGAAGNDPLYLTGPTGSGKSTIVEQVAAVLRQPLYVVSCHEAMEVTEFMGRWIVSNGNMIWQDSPLIAGVKDPLGAWILLDEEDTCRPGAAMVLNALVEGRSILIPETGEFLDPKKYGARFISAGNTTGLSDESGNYAGTNRQNLSLIGRYMMIKTVYPCPEDEIKIVSLSTPAFLPKRILETMVNYANEIRSSQENGDSGVVFCTRSLTRWAQLYCQFMKKPGVDPLHYSLDRAIANKYPNEQSAGLHEMVQRVFGETKANPSN